MIFAGGVFGACLLAAGGDAVYTALSTVSPAAARPAASGPGGKGLEADGAKRVGGKAAGRKGIGGQGAGDARRTGAVLKKVPSSTPRSAAPPSRTRSPRRSPA